MTTIVIQMDQLYEQVTHFHKICEHQQVYDKFGELEEMEFRTDEERCLILFINDGPCLTGSLEFRQLEFSHLNLDNVEITLEFGQMSKFHCHFDNVGEFPLSSKIPRNYGNNFFCWNFHYRFSDGMSAI